MNLEIITPDREVFSGEVEATTLPGSNGSFQVLKGHAPMISSLSKGSLKYKNAEGETKIKVDGGVVEVLKDKVTVLAEKVEQEEGK